MPASPISLEAVFEFGIAPITYVGFANGSNLLFALAGQPIARFNGMTTTVFDLAWSPDGRYLAIPTIFERTPGLQGITIFDCELGQTVAEIETPWVTRLTFHPHGGPFGELLATKGQDAVRLWKVGTWECVCVILEERSNHIGEAIGFHPVSPLFCTLGNKGKAIRVWRYDPKALLALTAHIPAAPVITLVPKSFRFGSVWSVGPFKGPRFGSWRPTSPEASASALALI